jgi:hypothetical protein
LTAALAGKPKIVQVALASDQNRWRDLANYSDGICSEASWCNDYKYRIKPVTINRIITIPEPLKLEPVIGSLHWVLALDNPNFVVCSDWKNSNLDNIRLSRGMIFSSRDDATMAARAMLGLSV